MAKKPTTKLLADVIDASELRPDLKGFVARVHRHAVSGIAFRGGPRYVARGGQVVFPSRMEAMDLVTACVRNALPGDAIITATPVLPKRVRKARRTQVLDNPTLGDVSALFDEMFEREMRKAERLAAARERAAKRTLPAVKKLLPERPAQIIRDKGAATRASLEAIIESGAVRVKGYGTPRHPGLPKKGAGVMPGHLDPVTMS